MDRRGFGDFVRPYLASMMIQSGLVSAMLNSGRLRGAAILSKAYRP